MENEQEYLKRQLINAKRTFDLTFEQVGSGRCVTDLDGWIKEVNQKFCDIIGYTMDETHKLRVKNLTYPEDWDIDWEYKKKLFAGEIPYFSMQKRYIKKDGSLTWVYTTVTLIKGNEDIDDYLIGIVQDINSQKAAEEWLMNENEKLEAIVADRTRQLIEANKIKDQTIKELNTLKELLLKNATIDPLTGLYNRRHMLEKITEELDRTKRTHHVFSLILTDIDYFKDINDLRGHDCGDEVLQTVSKLLKRELRSMDVVCRWGGEEFLILLPETSEDGARQIAERIRKRIQNHTFYYEEMPFTLTMTFGVSSFKGDHNIKEMIKEADLALYAGKDLGRNRVV